MSVPTGLLEEIQRGGIRTETKIKIQLDFPRWTELFSDAFDNAINPELDPAKWVWAKEWWRTDVQQSPLGYLTILPSALDAVAIPVWSRPGKAFPVRTDLGFTAAFTYQWQRVDTDWNGAGKTMLGIYSMETLDWVVRAISGIPGSGATGTVEFPAGTEIISNQNHGTDYGLELIYTPDNDQYELKIDSVSQGTITASLRHGLIFVFGAPYDPLATSPQGQQIKPTLTVTATTVYEDVVWPSWTDRETDINGRIWGILQGLTQGSQSIHEDNSADALQISILAQDIPGLLTYPSNLPNLFASFVFQGKLIERWTRVIDVQGRGTSWKRRFRGVVDSADVEVKEGQAWLRLQARDEYRQKMSKFWMTESYGDYGDWVGPRSGWIDSEIICDLFGIGALDQRQYRRPGLIGELPSTQLPAGVANIFGINAAPKTYNIVNQATLDAALRLMDEACTFPWIDYATEPPTFNVSFLNFGAGAASIMYYSLDDLLSLSWAVGAFGATGQVEYDYTNTNSTPVTARVPPVWVPDRTPSIAVQAILRQSLSPGTVPAELQFRWRRENRRLGAVTIVVKNQDWQTLGDEVGITDQRFTGHDPNKKLFVIAGWQDSWDGGEMTVSLDLVRQDLWKTVMENPVGA